MTEMSLTCSYVVTVRRLFRSQLEMEIFRQLQISRHQHRDSSNLGSDTYASSLSYQEAPSSSSYQVSQRDVSSTYTRAYGLTLFANYGSVDVVVVRVLPASRTAVARTFTAAAPSH